MPTRLIPLVLILLFYAYYWAHGQPTGRGANLLLPYLIVLPVLALYHRKTNYKAVTWSDRIILLLFLWPITLADLSGNSNLPLAGVHFDTVYRIIIMLVAEYAFVLVRRLPEVGFTVDASGRTL